MTSLVDDLRATFGLGEDDRSVVTDVDDLAAWLIARGVGKRGGRRRSRRERPEAPELGAASRRFARALAKRAAEGDDTALEQLVEVRTAVDEALGDAARSMHGFGYSWTEIGDRLGTTRQNARQRFGR